MAIALFLVVGIAAGFLATRIMGVKADLLTTIAIGIAGAFVGGFALRALVMVSGWFAGLVGAVLGAMLLIWLWKTYGR
ncbi:MAG: GlsB/YeaQ/YmgE family stress response membrane protein [Alphaproteobacteria bacterium]|jgi:uncharacterized membrane protein YeaQ/YmgE (transglycosylase-associated protein family)|nr:GlsB/YeaQ/YmgE family stress response membrane protein [Alphaproteobacteria bacterium]